MIIWISVCSAHCCCCCRMNFARAARHISSSSSSVSRMRFLISALCALCSFASLCRSLRVRYLCIITFCYGATITRARAHKMTSQICSCSGARCCARQPRPAMILSAMFARATKARVLFGRLGCIARRGDAPSQARDNATTNCRAAESEALAAGLKASFDFHETRARARASCGAPTWIELERNLTRARARTGEVVCVQHKARRVQVSAPPQTSDAICNC